MLFVDQSGFTTSSTTWDHRLLTADVQCPWTCSPGGTCRWPLATFVSCYSSNIIILICIPKSTQQLRLLPMWVHWCCAIDHTLAVEVGIDQIHHHHRITGICRCIAVSITWLHTVSHLDCTVWTTWLHCRVWNSVWPQPNVQVPSVAWLAILHTPPALIWHHLNILHLVHNPSGVIHIHRAITVAVAGF